MDEQWNERILTSQYDLCQIKVSKLDEDDTKMISENRM